MKTSKPLNPKTLTLECGILRLLLLTPLSCRALSACWVMEMETELEKSPFPASVSPGHLLHALGSLQRLALRE